MQAPRPRAEEILLRGPVVQASSTPLPARSGSPRLPDSCSDFAPQLRSLAIRRILIVGVLKMAISAREEVLLEAFRRLPPDAAVELSALARLSEPDWTQVRDCVPAAYAM